MNVSDKEKQSHNEKLKVQTESEARTRKVKSSFFDEGMRQDWETLKDTETSITFQSSVELSFPGQAFGPQHILSSLSALISSIYLFVFCFLSVSCFVDFQTFHVEVQLC